MSVDIRLWLGTFHNQRHLAHQVSIMFSAALLITGVISFVGHGISSIGKHEDFEGSQRRVMLVWTCAVLGLLSSLLNGAIANWHSKLDRDDPSVTEEQMTVRRINAVIIGSLSLTAFAVGLLVFFSALVRAGFVWPSIVVFLTAVTTLVAMCYDAASVVRKGHIELDEANAVPLTVDEFDA